MTSHATTERPLRVWRYRGWCWICQHCNPTSFDSRRWDDRTVPVGDNGAGHSFPDQQSAFAAALRHRHTERER